MPGSAFVEIIFDDHDLATVEDGGQFSFDFDPRQPLAPVLLTERQVCELLGIGRTTLRSLSLRPKPSTDACATSLATSYIAGLT